MTDKIGCPICKHNRFDGSCAAFPDGIPMIFLSGDKGHTEPLPRQQNDIVFEWASPQEQRDRMVVAIRESKAVLVPELAN
jgi:hypothetical protein